MGKAKTKFALSNFNHEKNQWQKFTWSPILGWAWPSISLTRIIQQLIQLLGSLLKIPTLLKSEGGCIYKDKFDSGQTWNKIFSNNARWFCWKFSTSTNFFKASTLFLISWLMFGTTHGTISENTFCKHLCHKSVLPNKNFGFTLSGLAMIKLYLLRGKNSDCDFLCHSDFFPVGKTS